MSAFTSSRNHHRARFGVDLHYNFDFIALFHAGLLANVLVDDHVVAAVALRCDRAAVGYPVAAVLNLAEPN